MRQQALLPRKAEVVTTDKVVADTTEPPCFPPKAEADIIGNRLPKAVADITEICTHPRRLHKRPASGTPFSCPYGIPLDTACLILVFVDC